MKRGNGKYSHLIVFLKNEPLKYSDMNRFLKSTERDENGYYGIAEEYKGGKWRKRKDYQGYGNTNLVQLTSGDNPLLKKNAEGKYEVTEYGWENRHHPFKRSPQDLERERQWRAEATERYERAIKQMTVIENHIAQITECVVYEDETIKIIKKVRS